MSGDPFGPFKGYQLRDREVVDYQTWPLDGTFLTLRGPKPPSLDPGAYFACVGAGQTWGCFVERPYPTLLSCRLGLPALNLGCGGCTAKTEITSPENMSSRPATVSCPLPNQSRATPSAREARRDKREWNGYSRTRREGIAMLRLHECNRHASVATR